jgi:hypothetical protein
MNSGWQHKYHKAQEFTKKGFPHIHCIVQSYFPDEHCYMVTYTCSGNIKKISEAVLNQLYALSAENDKSDAMKHLCERMGRKGYLNEDGETCSPSA